MLVFECTEGRSEKVAKLHSVTRNDRQESAALKLQAIDKSFASVSRGDYWAEKGEAGRWVRFHTHARTSAFFAMEGSRRTRKKNEINPRKIDERDRFTRASIQD